MYNHPHKRFVHICMDFRRDPDRNSQLIHKMHVFLLVFIHQNGIRCGRNSNQQPFVGHVYSQWKIPNFPHCSSLYRPEQDTAIGLTKENVLMVPLLLILIICLERRIHRSTDRSAVCVRQKEAVRL